MTDFAFQATGTGSVAAHHIGTAITDSVNVLTAELLNSARDLQAPAGLTNMPPLPLCFGRSSELGWLRGTLGQPAAGTAVVQGLGGVGKSTLALAYAHRHRSDYTVVWWIAAASSDHIEQSLADLALRLIPVWASSASTKERAAWTLSWLQWHPGWLLIFDNVEDPADLQPYVSASNGHVIATSRRLAIWPPSVATLAHPETIAVRANLGCAYRDAGHPSRSLPLLETAAAHSAQLLGEAHPQTLTTRNGLAKAYQAANDAGRAIAQYDTILKHRAALLGETHPHTLATRSGLANAHLAAGDPARAVPLFETVVAQCEQVFGESHPDTLSNYISLADAIRQSDDPARAVSLSESTLERCLRSLGEEHPHTVACRSNLALAHLTLGDAPRAVQVFEAAVRNASLVFGETHPHTVTSRTNLAAAHLESDNAAQAVAVLEELRAQLVAERGRVHSQTLNCIAMLARALGGSGGLPRATELLEHSVALTEKDSASPTQTRSNNGSTSLRSTGLTTDPTWLCRCTKAISLTGNRPSATTRMS
ncbi:tetratricopeptide repeat protein [Streptomyces sp. NPDC048209]|uniref:tetratricopeptide repeat protein n=1 Tax=Streptomyces sp. NPDC048209 TaxID=3156689 RepID=UPI00343AFC49